MSRWNKTGIASSFNQGPGVIGMKVRKAMVYVLPLRVRGNKIPKDGVLPVPRRYADVRT
jgi:hypothetical protein